MTNRQTAVAAIGAILVSLAPVPSIQKDASAQSAAAAPVLKIGGKVATPLELSAADLKKLPRKTLSVSNPHDKKTEVYDGVLLQDLFHRAGPVMATYVLAEASDGYRGVFSLAELDSEFADCDVIVADTMDGAPLGANQGPFKLVAPHDKRPARWVRMLKSLTVVQVEK